MKKDTLSANKSRAVLPCSLISGYFLASLIYVIAGNNSPFNSSYADGINLFVFLVIFAVCSAVILGYGSICPMAAYISLPVSICLMGMYSSYVTGNIYVAFGFCIVCGALSIILAKRVGGDETLTKSSPKFGKKASVVCLLVLSVLCFAYIVTCAVLRYASYTDSLSSGIYTQLLYFMSKTGAQVSTLESASGNLLSHLSVHLSPFLYALTPIFLIFPSSLTLGAIQGLAAVISVIPCCLLCRSRNLSYGCTALFSALLLISPALLGAASGNFSENCFLLPFLLFFAYFSKKKKIIPTVVFALLTLSLNESAALYLTVFSLYFLISEKKTDNSRKDRILHISISAVSFVYFAACLAILSNGTLSAYGALSGENDSLVALISSIIANPAATVGSLLNSNKINFLLSLLLPVLPIFLLKSKKSLILTLPIIFINLLPTQATRSSVLHGYVFGACAIIFYILLLALDDNKENSKSRRLALLSLCFALIIGASYASTRVYDSIEVLTEYSEDTEKISNTLEAIPSNANVSSSGTLISHLAARPHVYSLQSEKETDYVVIDLRYYTSTAAEQKYTVEHYEELGYERYIFEDECIAVMVRRGE